YSRMVSGSSRRTEFCPVSTASSVLSCESLLSCEKAMARHGVPADGPSRHEPTDHNRETPVPENVASHLPSGLKRTDTPDLVGTRCVSSLPVAASHTLAPRPQWLPVATQRPSRLTLMLRTS